MMLRRVALKHGGHSLVSTKSARHATRPKEPPAAAQGDDARAIPEALTRFLRNNFAAHSRSKHSKVARHRVATRRWFARPSSHERRHPAAQAASTLTSESRVIRTGPIGGKINGRSAEGQFWRRFRRSCRWRSPRR